MDKEHVEVLCEHVISGKCKRPDCPAAKRNTVGIGSCIKTGKGMFAYKYSCNSQGDVLLLADKVNNPNYLFSIKKANEEW
jgi:hypothetical protein